MIDKYCPVKNQNVKTQILISFLLFLSLHMFAQEKLEKNNMDEFISFLENHLKSDVINTETTKTFFKQSWDYWHKNKIDYNSQPTKYKKALTLFYKNKEKNGNNSVRDVNRYQSKIENFKNFDTRNTLAQNPILFVGSSSISGWETAIAFPDLPIINRGLGGISVPEILHYYDVLIKKHEPKILVMYCDIDVESGKSPSVVIDVFKTLVNKIKTDFPKTQILIMAMKPTLIDDFLGKSVGENKITTNIKLATYCDTDKNLHFIDIVPPMLKPDGHLRSDIFIADGMHLNSLGYSLWNPILDKKIKILCIN